MDSRLRGNDLDLAGYRYPRAEPALVQRGGGGPLRMRMHCDFDWTLQADVRLLPGREPRGVTSQGAVAFEIAPHDGTVARGTAESRAA